MFDKKNKSRHPQNILRHPKGYLLAFELDSSLILFKSTDNGISWFLLNNSSLFNWYDGGNVAQATINVNGEILIPKNKGLYISPDDGRTWQYKE